MKSEQVKNETISIHHCPNQLLPFTCSLKSTASVLYLQVQDIFTIFDCNTALTLVQAILLQRVEMLLDVCLVPTPLA